MATAYAAAPGAGGVTAAAAGSGAAGLAVVYVTAPNPQVADSLATALVESRLAACVNILPGVKSVYRWQGKVERDDELLLVIKTQSQLLSQLSDKVKALHPYDTPEVLALPVTGGSPAYLQWLISSTQEGDDVQQDEGQPAG